jgi:hypothetical protein
LFDLGEFVRGSSEVVGVGFFGEVKVLGAGPVDLEGNEGFTKKELSLG